MGSVWSTITEELRTAVAAAVPTVPVEQIAFESPPDPKLGDLAFPCFALAKELRQPPATIAQRIAEQLAAHPLVAVACAAGPYVNIVVDSGELARRTLAAVAEAGDRYGNALPNTDENLPKRDEMRRAGASSERGVADYGERAAQRSASPKGRSAREAGSARSQGGATDRPLREVIALEFISPNTNKPLHLGHLRNAFLGESIGRLLETQGHTVHRVCLLNDRGVHIMKSILAYERWGHRTTPASEGVKGDHFVGNWYVVFDQKSKAQRQEFGIPDGEPTPLEREAAEMLRKWEAGDPDVRAAWETMRTWVCEGFRATYVTIGVAFEQEYPESAIYEEGRAIVREALERGKFQKDDRGNTIAPLKDRFDLPDKVVERADGTTVYVTQDLALAAAKVRDFHPDRSIIVTASEQDLYFQQLFAIFRLLEVPWADRSVHKSYGMVMLPEGRMKSREGTVVDADDLIAELARMAEEEIRSRADVVPGEPAPGTDEPPIVVSDVALARAKDIALAAIRFYLLLVTPATTVTFNPKASLAFTGKTGPYLQYAHARLCSIRRKASGDVGADFTSARAGMNPAPTSPELLAHPAEKQLLLRIANFPDVVAAAAEELDPSTVAQYCYDLAQAFSSFYRDVPVLKAESPELREARLALCDAVRVTLARGLTILGITPLAEM